MSASLGWPAVHVDCDGNLPTYPASRFASSGSTAAFFLGRSTTVIAFDQTVCEFLWWKMVGG